ASPIPRSPASSTPFSLTSSTTRTCTVGKAGLGVGVAVAVVVGVAAAALPVATAMPAAAREPARTTVSDVMRRMGVHLPALPGCETPDKAARLTRKRQVR